MESCTGTGTFGVVVELCFEDVLDIGGICCPGERWRLGSACFVSCGGCVFEK